MKLASKENIEVPIEQVFDMLIDFDRHERSAMRRGADVLRTDKLGEAGVGVAWDISFDFRGKARKLALEVIEFDQPYEMTLQAKMQGLDSTINLQLVALSKTSDINFAVTAVGSAPHVAGVAVERATGAKWIYVPYKGGAQAVADTIAGQTQVIMNGMLATLPSVQNGRLKVLGISKKTRMPLVGEVPTLSEQGVTDFESGTWQGVVVPRGTPAAIVARLNAELIKVIRSPDVRARLTGQGAEVVTMQPAEQDAFFERERKRWGAVVAAANIKLD